MRASRSPPSADRTRSARLEAFQRAYGLGIVFLGAIGILGALHWLAAPAFTDAAAWIINKLGWDPYAWRRDLRAAEMVLIAPYLVGRLLPVVAAAMPSNVTGDNSD
jgi:hypothetical protein